MIEIDNFDSIFSDLNGLFSYAPEDTLQLTKNADGWYAVFGGVVAEGDFAAYTLGSLLLGLTEGAEESFVFHNGDEVNANFAALVANFLGSLGGGDEATIEVLFLDSDGPTFFPWRALVGTTLDSPDGDVYAYQIAWGGTPGHALRALMEQAAAKAEVLRQPLAVEPPTAGFGPPPSEIFAASSAAGAETPAEVVIDEAAFIGGTDDAADDQED